LSAREGYKFDPAEHLPLLNAMETSWGPRVGPGERP
jgi:hypothetical protein